jgi:hypothetical protein
LVLSVACCHWRGRPAALRQDSSLLPEGNKWPKLELERPLFARYFQLASRAKVIGDHTSGRVLRGQYFSRKMGQTFRFSMESTLVSDGVASWWRGPRKTWCHTRCNLYSDCRTTESGTGCLPCRGSYNGTSSPRVACQTRRQDRTKEPLTSWLCPAQSHPFLNLLFSVSSAAPNSSKFRSGSSPSLVTRSLTLPRR